MSNNKQDIINCAIQMIEKSFSDTSLSLAIEYINFKFNESLHFAYLTGIHYSIFRKNKDKKEKIKLQAIIELIILAADIMDDIQDNDSKNNPWSKMDIGININIIVGLLVVSLKNIESSITDRDVNEYTRKQIYILMLRAVDGQQQDLTNQINSEKDYIEMVKKKSGSLILLANLIGVGHTSNDVYQIIEEYSNCLGIISQIRNDVHDLINNTEKSDLRNKKKTLPIIYYLYIDDPKFKIVKEFYNNNDSYEKMNYEYRESLHKIIVQGGGVHYCIVVEQLFVHKYQEMVNCLNIAPSLKEQLITLKI